VGNPYKGTGQPIIFNMEKEDEMKIRSTIGFFAVLIVIGLLIMPVISNSNAQAADKVI